eukprot:jgi/Botrbrau1/277/Bobra.0022s0246.1
MENARHNPCLVWLVGKCRDLVCLKHDTGTLSELGLAGTRTGRYGIDARYGSRQQLALRGSQYYAIGTYEDCISKRDPTGRCCMRSAGSLYHLSPQTTPPAVLQMEVPRTSGSLSPQQMQTPDMFATQRMTDAAEGPHPGCCNLSTIQVESSSGRMELPQVLIGRAVNGREGGSRLLL